jgi:hypothetical protein
MYLLLVTYIYLVYNLVVMKAKEMSQSSICLPPYMPKCVRCSFASLVPPC